MEFKDKLKRLRQEKGISQQALADAIFVSRSAVAKWENGLGVPSGESRQALIAYFGVTEDYFSTEAPEKVIVEKNINIRLLKAVLIAALVVAAAAMLVWMQCSGVFSVRKRVTSPNGQVTTTVYDGTPGGFFLDGGFTLEDKGLFQGRSIYPDAAFQGLAWSPNSRYLLISMYGDGGLFYWLHDYGTNSVSNLLNYLGRAIWELENFDRAVLDEDGRRDIHFEFLHWDRFESEMYVSFRFLMADGGECHGYFWYDPTEGTIRDLDMETYE